MYDPIQEGPPVITVVTHTDDLSIRARVLCLVDGFTAEIQHDVNTRRQEYSNHFLRVFDPARRDWTMILSWGFVEVGHVPVHPDAETIAYLTDISQVMWETANAVVVRSRLRQHELDLQHHDTIAQYTDTIARYNDTIARYDNTLARYAENINDEDAYPTVYEGELIAPEAPYTGNEPEDQG